MRKQHSIAVLTISLLISILDTGCSGGNMAAPTPTPVPPTATAVPTDPPTSTPTETPIPSPTAQPTSTPIPGVFLNRPSYLLELFSSDEWLWSDPVLGIQVGQWVFNNSRIVLAFSPDGLFGDKLMVKGMFEIDPEARIEDEEFFREFTSTLMRDFLPSTAIAGFNEFLYVNTVTGAPGFYETSIEDFRVVLEVEDDTGDEEHIISLEIYEK